MKKNIFILIPVIALVLFFTSCSKTGSDTAPATYTSAEGMWAGTYTNITGGPAAYFAINLKPVGAITVYANNAITPDIANGSWSLVGDSVKASFTYVNSSATYSLAGKYSNTSNIMTGTIGVGASTTGEAVFSVTKQQ